MALNDHKLNTKPNKAIVARSPLLDLEPDFFPVLKPNPKIRKVWDELLTDPPVNHSDKNNWRTEIPDIRPSSFPFCPRKYGMSRLGLNLPSNFTVKSNYYTEIGNAVHKVIQNAFARTGRLWGFWECARPSCQKRWSDQPSFHPDAQCPHCGTTKFMYEELTLWDDDINLKGHADGVIFFQKHQSVLEIKTAGDDKVTKLKELGPEDLGHIFRNDAPWTGYTHQASTYASKVRELYPEYITNLTTVEFVIASRDNPDNVVALSLDVPQDDRWWKEIKARVRMAQRAVQLRILPMGFAKDQLGLQTLPTCKYCEYKEHCLNAEVSGMKHDALKDKEQRRLLKRILDEERERPTSMGTIIRGDVVETSEILVAQPAEDEQKKQKQAEEDAKAGAEDQKD